MQLLSATFLIITRIQPHTGLHVKYLLLLSGFNETWIVSTDSQNTLKYRISLTSVQCEPSYSVRADGQAAEMTNLIVAFRNSANETKYRLSKLCKRAQNPSIISRQTLQTRHTLRFLLISATPTSIVHFTIDHARLWCCCQNMATIYGKTYNAVTLHNVF